MGTGNSKFDLNKDNLNYLERQVLEQCNYKWIDDETSQDGRVKGKRFSYYHGDNWQEYGKNKNLVKMFQIDVKVGEYENEPVYMRTIVAGKWKPNAPILVHQHGFGGSSALSAMIIQDLHKHFNLILFDNIGMGGSSRPNDFKKDFTPQQCIDYFIHYTEEWRKAMPRYYLQLGDELTNFILVAHSLGGYMGGHYACKYPQHIKKLILLSPIGVLDYPFSHNSKRKLISSHKAFKDIGVTSAVWKMNITPMSLCRIYGKKFHQVMYEYCEETAKTHHHPSFILRQVDYMYQIYSRPGTTEHALMICVGETILAHVPLATSEKLLNPKLKFGVSFIYGDSDWIRPIDEDAPERVVEMHKDKNSRLYSLPESGHLLHFDNPISLANIIINDVLGGVNGKELEVGPDLRRGYEEI